MNNKDPWIQDKTKRCDVCRVQVNVDQFGQGKCSHCGWEQCEICLHNSHKVYYPNYVPFNKAVTLYKSGKKIVPDLDDFIGMFHAYAEVQFEYKEKIYGLCGSKNKLSFFENQSSENTQTFKTDDEFKEKAHINGRLLRDIWHEVENASYM